jgi:hypothetical protein
MRKKLLILLTILAVVFAMGLSYAGEGGGNGGGGGQGKGHGTQDPPPEDPPCDADNHQNRMPPGLEDKCPGEEGPPGDETCSDGIDNDGDGKTDQEDEDCQEPEGPGDTCSDGIDNDGDGKTDQEDEDCQEPEGPPGDPTCSDGIDNDGDGLTDEDDPDCQDGPGTEGPPGDPTCSDGIDNDEDGLIDEDDPDCQEEPPAPSCDDPDGDGVDHSAFDPDSNEGGPVSSIVHEVDQALPSPLGGDQGVVTEVNCALIVTVEEILGING